MASVKFGGENQSWEIAESLKQIADERGKANADAAIAKASAIKAQISQRAFPGIMQEDHARETMDKERALRAEIEKRKEKQAKERAKTEGTDTGLETLSEVRPVNGDTSKSFVNRIANPQAGVSKTGPGGTLVGSQLGSAAFPSEITQTTTREVMGDRGQRGALIRQGPVAETTTRTYPNVLTAGDMLRAQQQESQFGEQMQQRQEEFDWQKTNDTRTFEIVKAARMSEINLNKSRNEREQIEFDRAKGVADLSFNQNLKVNFPKEDPAKLDEVARAYAENNISRVMELTKNWGPGETAKAALLKAQQDTELTNAQIEKTISETRKNNFEAGVFFNGQANNPSFLGEAGFTSQQIQAALDPVAGRQVQDDLISMSKNGFKNGEFQPQYEAPFHQMQDTMFARGKILIRGEKGFWGGDATMSTTEVADAGQAYVTLLHGMDPDSHVKVSPDEMAAAKHYLIRTGLVQETAQGLVATEGNEVPFERLDKAANSIYSWQKAYKNETGKEPEKRPSELLGKPKAVDSETGVPMSAREKKERARQQMYEIRVTLSSPGLDKSTRQQLNQTYSGLNEDFQKYQNDEYDEAIKDKLNEAHHKKVAKEEGARVLIERIQRER